MDFSISLGLGEYCRYGVVRGVRFYDDRGVRRPMRQNGSGGEREFQMLESSATLVRELPESSFSGETSEQDYDLRVIVDEPSVEVGKA